MTDILLNDNERIALAGETPDVGGHGHAAIVLTESILHSLIARDALSTSDAIEIVTTAVEVQRDTLADLLAPDLTMQRSLAVLNTILLSLQSDMIGD